ncbi:MAG TPA: 16S rRNA (adenine(1518)-N(6)/adenine(1519)-N(6))-dimethyltransferase RsmA [Longimicrobiales bacterium]|nr:16S rRNA (adenine(1518)-N(6)/adenine(1519)-N(6))-dimethyltransferase RsmA [Longimicrobiales bacterium]
MRAKRSLGQNFLVDPNAQRRIVEALEASADDEVIEIGPGQGALTRHLAGTVRRLTLVELDDELAAALAAEYAGRGDVVVVHRDVLETDIASLLEDPARAKIVGNIPYNITTPILFHLLDARPRPERIVVMIQREVAERIIAAPGGKTYGALSVAIRAVADVERVMQVKRGAFRPAPDVDSTVIRIRPRVPVPLGAEEEHDLRELTRAAFGRRRKQLGTILRDAPEYALAPADIERIGGSVGVAPDRRPETIDPPTFVALARALRGIDRPRHLGASA